MTDSDDTVPLPPSHRVAAPSDDFEPISDAALRGMLGAARHGDWQPPTLEELQRALPQYEVKEFVARGGMGAVYRGVQRALERAVAIKVLPPEVEQGDFHFAERFKSEAKAMARLEHPNIVTVHDAGETAGGLLYFVMEFVRGSDVQEIIAKDGKMEPRRALEITCAVLDALAFAHESGIIHRDIKPSNVMFDTKGRVKVADFGLAKTMNSESAGFTGSEVMLGTADFIAPEASIKGIQLDARADIYAVGVMLYVMLTGKIPRGRFEMPTAVLPKIDPRLDAIVDKAMQTDRDRRYASAAEMKAAVEKVIAETRTGAMPMPTVVASRRQSPLMPVIISVVVIAIAAAAFFIFKKPASAERDTAGVVAASPAIPVPAKAASTVPMVPQEKWIDRLDEWFARPTASVSRLTKLPEGARVETHDALPVFTKPARDAAVRVVTHDAMRQLTLYLRMGKGKDAQQERYGAGYNPTGGSLSIHRFGESEKPDKLAQVFLPASFDTRAKHSFEFRAVGDHLTFDVDGKQALEVHDSAYASGKSNLSTEPGTVFEKIEYLILDEGGSMAPASTVPASAPSAPKDHWTDRVNEWFTLPNPSVSKLAKLPDGTVRVESKDGITIIWQPVRDMAVRVTVREFAHLALNLRAGAMVGTHKESYAAAIDPHGLTNLACYQPGTGEHVDLARVALPGFDPKAKHTVEFRAVGDRLTVIVDGKQVIDQHDATYRQGTSGITAQPGTIFEKIEYAVFDEQPNVPAPAPAQRGTAEKWTDALADWIRVGGPGDDFVPQNDGTALCSGRYPSRLLVLPPDVPPPQDQAVRASFRLGQATHAFVEVRRGYVLVLQREGSAAKLGVQDRNGHLTELQSWPLPSAFDFAAAHSLELRAVGDELTASLDGAKLGSARDAQLRRGSPCAGGEDGVVITKLDYLLLDK